jgi:hypothetical protein
MTDSELLELAAKAAGAVWIDQNFPYDEFGRMMLDFGGGVSEWNPLTDDGDALRLAVKLDIEFYQGDDDGPSVYAGYWGKSERRDVTRLFASEPMSDDPYAATRRAIVRAAAEIGKQMEK